METGIPQSLGKRASAWARSTTGRLFLPVVLIVLLGAGLISTVLIAAADRLDESAREHQTLLVESILATEAKNLRRVAKDNSWSGDVIARIVENLDLGWADDNIGTYLLKEYDLTGSYVVDAQDRTRYAAYNRGWRKRTDAFKRFGPGLKALIEKARAGRMDQSFPVSAFLMEAGEPHLVIISPITREMPTRDQQVRAPRPVLILSRTFDDFVLADWSKGYHLKDLRLLEKAPAEGAAYVTLNRLDGMPLAVLAWTPATPGSDLAAGLWGVIIVSLLILTGLTGFFLYRAEAFAGVLRDNVEDLVDAKTRAELANRSKTLFLANVSHELRTPLNAVLAFSEIMKTQAFGPVGSPKYLEYATDIHESGSHLLALIDDLLDLSRIEANRADLHETELDIDHIMDWAAHLIRPQAQQRKLNLQVSRGAPNMRLYADERALKQILLNLLTNAVKFTPEGGSVMLMAEAEPQGGLAFTVLDTGVGIPAGILHEVLLPFQQGEQSYVRNKEGAGLGLALVQALCKLHDARLVIDSTEGVGTKLTVHFPAERVFAPAPVEELRSA